MTRRPWWWLWHRVDTLTVRIAASFIVLLVLFHVGVSALFIFITRGPPPEGVLLPGRIQALVDIVEALPAGDRPDLVAALTHPDVAIAWSPSGTLPADAPTPNSPIAAFVRIALRSAQDVSVRIDEARTVHAAARLSDGSILAFVLRDPKAPYPDPTRFLLWVGLTAMLAVVGSVLLARHLAAPLRVLATTAERIGRSETPMLNTLSGPREMRTLGTAFIRMHERLQRFLDDRTRMLAAIAHDLRTPLTRLRLRTEFVEADSVRDKMLADIDQMSAMVGATLLFARDDRSQEPVVEIALTDLLREIADGMVDLGRTVSLRAAPGVRYRGAPIALARAITNLVDNACRHGGSARVTLIADAAGVEILIDDDGPGIPDALLDEVFQPFVRVDAARNLDDGSGSGLGLAIARSIARSHGGDVFLQNRPEGGLRARMTLPS